jgi:DNA primase
LYPHWPRPGARTLILTESVIDAATLEQQRPNIETLFTDGRHSTQILACYGTNGFTADHGQAIKELEQLEEIIIFFDGDEAGREGTKRTAEKLNQLRPEIKISFVQTPEGEDINSLAQSHESEVFTHLIEKRTAFIFLPAEASAKVGSIENKKADTKSESKAQPIHAGDFDTTNPLKIIYRTITAPSLLLVSNF